MDFWWNVRGICVPHFYKRKAYISTLNVKQNWAVWDNKHLSFHNFCGSEIQEQLRIWLRIFSEVAVKLLAVVIRRLARGRRICFQTHTYWHTLVPHGLESLRSLPNRPCHRAVWVSLRHGSWLLLEQVVECMCVRERERKREREKEDLADIPLLSNVLLSQISHDTVWEGTAYMSIPGRWKHCRAS